MSQIESKGLDGDSRWAGRSEAGVGGSGGRWGCQAQYFGTEVPTPCALWT